MIAIESRKKAQCEDCYETTTVYAYKVNDKNRVECKKCRDKRIDKWFDSKEPTAEKKP